MQMNWTTKVLIIWEGHKNLKKKSQFFAVYIVRKIKLWDFFMHSGLLIMKEVYKITQGAAQHRGKQIGITAAPWLFA